MKNKIVREKPQECNIEKTSVKPPVTKDSGRFKELKRQHKEHKENYFNQIYYIFK